MTSAIELPIDDVRFVKELYPRLREDDAAIERYRAAIDRLPPIVVARGGVLVDGFHRWQAHRREGRDTIAAVDLGNLTELEIRKESLRLNSSHGQQLSDRDKRRQASELFLLGVDESELVELLSTTKKYMEKCLRDAKATEKRRQQEDLWDRWLNCEFESYRDAGRAFGINHETAASWCGEFSTQVGNSPPESRQHFDVWSFGTDGGDSSYFGRMPPQVVENVLWFWTEPGQIVVDPFAGGGTTIDVAKAMGRRVWASDRKPITSTRTIHEHDITTGWPADAPRKADLILLDPPYWQQAAGKYSDDPADLANMPLDGFYAAWNQVVKTCAAHLSASGHIAYIISPTQCDDGTVVDHATDMLAAFANEGFTVTRRVIVPYSTQQATGQQVTWARDGKRLLKLYRDLVVLSR